jgi:ABC-type transport system substrate-binding protein
MFLLSTSTNSPSLDENSRSRWTGSIGIRQIRWVPGSDGIREKGGQQLTFEMTARAGNKVVEGYVAVFLEGCVLNQVLDVTYDFNVVNTGFNRGADPDQAILWHSESYKAGFNNMKYPHSRVDELLDQSLQTLDIEQRKAHYAEMQNLILADMPAFVLDFTKTIWGVNARVKNLIPNPVLITFNPHQWYVTDGS